MINALDQSRVLLLFVPLILDDPLCLKACARSPLSTGGKRPKGGRKHSYRHAQSLSRATFLQISSHLNGNFQVVAE